MFNLYQFSIRLSVAALLLGLAACAGGETVEEGYYNPDSPAARAWEDEHTGDDENLGPNSPGYTGPDGEFSMYPDSDPQ